MELATWPTFKEILAWLTTNAVFIVKIVSNQLCRNWANVFWSRRQPIIRMSTINGKQLEFKCWVLPVQVPRQTCRRVLANLLQAQCVMALLKFIAVAEITHRPEDRLPDVAQGNAAPEEMTLWFVDLTSSPKYYNFNLSNFSPSGGSWTQKTSWGTRKRAWEAR